MLNHSAAKICPCLDPTDMRESLCGRRAGAGASPGSPTVGDVVCRS